MCVGLPIERARNGTPPLIFAVHSHTATQCNTLQHTSTHCNTPQLTFLLYTLAPPTHKPTPLKTVFIL